MIPGFPLDPHCAHLGCDATNGGCAVFSKRMLGETWHCPCACRAKYLVSILQPGRHLAAPKSGKNQLKGPLRSPDEVVRW